jgi:hypothetical protein
MWIIATVTQYELFTVMHSRFSPGCGILLNYYTSYGGMVIIFSGLVPVLPLSATFTVRDLSSRGDGESGREGVFRNEDIPICKMKGVYFYEGRAREVNLH